MKTTFIASLAAATMLTGAAYAANAPVTMSDGFFFKPYVGADYQYSYLSYPSVDGLSGSDFASDSMNGFDLHVGARVHKYLGIEAGYMWNETPSKNNILGTGINDKVNIKGFTLDAMGYLPVDEAGKFELIGTAGVSRLKGGAKFTGAFVENDSESETKGRIGGGAQYWITDSLNVRGLVRYQGVNFSDSINNDTIASLGLNWQF